MTWRASSFCGRDITRLRYYRWPDYKPNITGIKQYHYEPNGNAYNLYFEQFSHKFGVKEIVMYNKLEGQNISSHDSDLLLLTPREIDR